MNNRNRIDRLENNPFDSSVRHVAPFGLSQARFGAVNAIRQHGTLARTNIADIIGYSPSKITLVVNELLDEGILSEVDDGKSTGGRRPRNIGFNPNFGYIVVANIGTTKLDIALVDFSERIRVRRMLPINIKDGPDSILTNICEFILERIKQLDIPVNKIFGFTITIPGAVDTKTAVPFENPLMPGWGGYAIDSLINETFPYAVVVIENDANAMAFGELRKGRGQGVENYLYVKVGASLHAGIIANSQIYHGSNGRAGAIGNMFVDYHKSDTSPLESIPLNDLVSGEAIANHARQAILSGETDTILNTFDAQTVTARDVASVAAEGDAVAIEILQTCGEILGHSLSAIVNILDPQLILVGGGVSNMGHQFLAAIRRSILDRSPALSTENLRIEIAPLGSEASILGSIALALESIFVLEA